MTLFGPFLHPHPPRRALTFGNFLHPPPNFFFFPFFISSPKPREPATQAIYPMQKYVTPKKLRKGLACILLSCIASLPTSCLHSSHCLSQVVSKFGTNCEQLVTTLLILSDLLQGCSNRVRYNRDIAILFQPCIVNLVTFLLYHDCIRLVRTTL